MKEINTENWQEFQIGKLFQVSRGRRFVVGKHKEGNIPYYSASLENNGITDYISNPLFIDKNAIIVTTFCDAFYAKGEFTASDEITILHHEKMNEINGLFIASTIRKNAWKYSFKVKAFQTRIIEDTIKLPINKKGEPDWEYMESYMKNIMQESERDIENLKNICNSEKEIVLNNWKDFKIGGENGLFEVTRPNARSAQTYNEGDMPYIASGCFNNGVCGYFEPKNKGDFDKGNCITVSPVDGYAFYQKDNFLGRGGAGSSIIILRRDNLNEYIGKFICTVIRKTCKDWSYSNMGNKDKFRDTIIKLPTNSKGEPDWKYMENYMKNIMANCELKLDNLKLCV